MGGTIGMGVDMMEDHFASSDKNGSSPTPSPLKSVNTEESNEDDAAQSKKNTLQPGPHAGKSIPARGAEPAFTKPERDEINEIGRNTGCHTCGSLNPGTKSGNFIPDHQPPSKLNPDDTPQDSYPHCLSCSRSQGGQVRALKGWEGM
ncbi:hypothetical protein [Agrobacterium vitis]|nr:hypothetical protein [Agrobacterium vitis]